MFHSYDDSDIDFIKLAVQTSLKCLVTVIGEDTDLLVLQMYHAEDNSRPLQFKKVTKVKRNSIS